MTTTERWAQIEDLFHRASECDPQERANLLAEVGDSELRREVEALLASEKSATRDLDGAVLDGLDAVIFPLVGATVSHYHILGGLGAGGMGLLYRAEDIRLGRKVALKFLLEESARNPTTLARFEREARSISALEHPNICPVYEFGEHEGQPFLVMPLLEGQTLRELISARGQDKPPLEIGNLLESAIQIASGLETAHRHEIIHRDIKPANLFVTTEGQVKILDFGLAKLRQPEILEGTALSGARETEQPADASVTFTRSGAAMGTAGYMSPEQVRGEELDARTDVFSFGVVLYEMATGQPAFSGETAAQRYDAILNDATIPAKKLNPGVPAKLESILDKALIKDRQSRYQTVSEMRADLEALKHSSESKYRKAGMALAAFVLVTLVGTILWLARHEASTRGFPEITQRQLTSNSIENGVGASAISPDGKYLAYCDQFGLQVEEIRTGQTRTVAQGHLCSGGPENWILAWFLHGTTLLVSQSSPSWNWGERRPGIWSVALWGGTIRKLRDDAYNGSVSPNGSLVAFTEVRAEVGDREIWLMDSDGSHARKLYQAEEQSSFYNIRWSPDSQRLIYIKNLTGNVAGELRLESRDLNGGSPTVISSPAPVDYDWVSDDRIIFALAETDPLSNSANLWELHVDPHTGQPQGKPRRLTNWAGFSVGNLSASVDGKHLAFRRWTDELAPYVAELSTGGTRITTPKRVTLVEGDTIVLAWTPNSNEIVVYSVQDGVPGFYRQSLEKNIAEPIITGFSVLHMTRSSPDRASLFYWIAEKQSSALGMRAPVMDLMRVPIAGGPSHLVLSSSPETVWRDDRCASSPATLCVLLERDGNSGTGTFTAFDPVKGRERELFKFGGLSPTNWAEGWDVSPDGRSIAIIKSDGKISILSLQGRLLREIAPKGWTLIFSFDWAADGRGWFTVGGTTAGRGLLHIDLEGNALLLWPDTRNREIEYAIPSPDGHRLAISAVMHSSSNIWMIENF